MFRVHGDPEYLTSEVIKVFGILRTRIKTKIIFSEKIAQCCIVYIISENYFKYKIINQFKGDGILHKIIS